jgi:hypothetical protein
MESGGRVTGLGILLAHLAGDYLIQSHYMAAEKVNRWWPAVAHGVTYTVPYVFVTRSPAALLTIAGTHVVIDRWRLAKHVVWLKNLAGCVYPGGTSHHSVVVGRPGHSGEQAVDLPEHAHRNPPADRRVRARWG